LFWLALARIGWTLPVGLAWTLVAMTVIVCGTLEGKR
jgi:hypothetical protein